MNAGEFYIVPQVLQKQILRFASPSVAVLHFLKIMKTPNFSSKMMHVDVTYYIAECIADHTIRALSALDYLNLDPCSVSTVCVVTYFHCSMKRR